MFAGRGLPKRICGERVMETIRNGKEKIRGLAKTKLFGTGKELHRRKKNTYKHLEGVKKGGDENSGGENGDQDSYNKKILKGVMYREKGSRMTGEKYAVTFGKDDIGGKRVFSLRRFETKH